MFTLRAQSSYALNVIRISIPLIALSVLLVVGLIYLVITFFPWTYPNKFYYLFVTSPLVALITTAILAVPIVWLNLQVVQDVAEQRKKAEDAKTQLEKIIEQRARFVAYVSHEIRNPLNGIAGIVESFGDTNHSKEYNEKFNAIRESTTDLMAILNDILDLSKVDSGALTINPRPTNLGQIIQEMVGFWNPRAQSNGLKLELRVAAELPKWVMVDASRFRQIANNLISNAVKYTDKGAINIRVDCDKNAKLVVFSVSDTGPGIPETLRELIFDPYIQVPENSDVPSKVGTGLGLPIARQLARQMGGDVWIRNSVSKGSHFSFSVAIEETNEPKTPELNVERRQTLYSGKKALVVDDMFTNCLVAKEMLGKLGFAVETSASGANAIAKLNSEQFDLVLLDDELGDMRGSDVFNATKSDQSSAKFVAYTGHTQESDRERFKQLGMHGFIGKPIHIRGIEAELARVFENT